MKVKLRTAHGELELDGIKSSEQRGYFLFTFRAFPFQVCPMSPVFALDYEV